jgi:hypothetical protein
MISTSDLYDYYRVTIQLRDKLCGGIPKNPDLIKAWVEAGTGHKDAKSEQLTEEAKAALLDDVAEKSWNGFLADPERGIFIESRQVKAMFKECASLLRITTKKIGSKQILQHGFEVKAPDGGQRIYLGRNKADGNDEQAIHVQTAQGPRSAIKRVDYVSEVKVTFQVWVLKTAAGEKRHLGKSDLERMLGLAQENGLGADRSQGRGKFDVTEFEKIDKPM